MSKYTPKADAANVVEFAKARFTLLTDRMLRLEWARDGVFEDRASLAAANRKMPRVAFDQSVSQNRLTIKTDSLTLVYIDDGRKLSKSNLKISFKGSGISGTWTPGMKDKLNLKGTYRTLDNFHGDRDLKGRRIPLCDGLVSTSGWSCFDDSASVVLDETAGDQPWAVARRPGQRQDMYFLGYGLDFKAALKDSSRVFGRQPLPPRYALGYWWSRYWEYNDKELEQLVEQFNDHGVPLDVLVIDMDWHREGWTGYSWDKRFFPDHKEFLGWLKNNDLKITLNLHPADGVASHEDQFKDMAESMGLNPAKTDRVEFDCTDPEFVKFYFKVLHHPQEDMGVDFWWMDWQQGTKTKLPSLDPLSWINHLHYVDMQQRTPDRRPIIFSRFGGLGAGRYPVGFSGDTVADWKSLAYQPYFTATASNVHYGYWSHDIGGHHLSMPTAELYLRWIQFGIFSPILRTHTTKNPKCERKVWEYPAPHSDLMVKAIKRRYEMVPYIYSECRKVIDSGLSLCRPMYYDHPRVEVAYSARDQYMFGDEMLAAPVVTPVSEKDEMAEQTVWLPKGKWFDDARGVWETGGRKIKRRYMADEIPVFVRPGTIIPGQRTPKRLRPGSYLDLMVTAYPGGDGSYELYEDDGVSQGYDSGEFAIIAMSQRAAPSKRTVIIKKASGGYKGFKNKRSLEVRMPSTGNVKSVKVGGKILEQAYRLGDTGWTWDPAIGGVVLRVKSIDLSANTKIEIAFDGKSEAGTGFAGAVSRLERIRQLASYAVIHRVAHKLGRLHADAFAATTRIAMAPDTIDTEKRKLRKMLSRMDEALSWRLANCGSKDTAAEYIAKAKAIAKELCSWF